MEKWVFRRIIWDFSATPSGIKRDWYVCIVAHINQRVYTNCCFSELAAQTDVHVKNTSIVLILFDRDDEEESSRNIRYTAAYTGQVIADS
jgi:hypothetical protein